MNKLVSRPALLGFAYLNGMLGVMIWVSSYRGPEFVGFLVSLPFVLIAVLVPRFGRGWWSFPAGRTGYALFLTVVYFVAMFLAAMGERRLALLNSGETVTGISVREVPAHPDAVAFDFTDGRGREELQGRAQKKKSRGGVDDWYVVPVVAEDWNPRQPVTVWALHLNRVQPEVAAGRFRAGVLVDEQDEKSRYAKQAVKAAEDKHGIRPDPHSVILEMGQSVADLRNTAAGFLILAFAAVNLTWSVAVIRSRPSEKALGTPGKPAERLRV